MESIERFARAAKKWNRDVYGNIAWRKEKLMRPVAGLQLALESRRLERLLQMGRELRGELEITLDQEELLWYQKSRVF